MWDEHLGTMKIAAHCIEVTSRYIRKVNLAHYREAPKEQKSENEEMDRMCKKK